MKRDICFFLAALLLCGTALNHTCRSFAGTVVERGPHHRVFEKVVSPTEAAGQVQTRTARWTELQTGLPNFKDGNWLESEATTRIHLTGAATLEDSSLPVKWIDTSISGGGDGSYASPYSGGNSDGNFDRLDDLLRDTEKFPISPLVIRFKPGQYKTRGRYHSWFGMGITKGFAVRPGWQLIGSGMYNTTLQLVDCIEDPNGASGIMTVVGSNTADGNNHMAIEDLTLDCNYDWLTAPAPFGGGKPSNLTLHGAYLYGTDGLRIENVRVINFAGKRSAGGNPEAFAIMIGTGRITPSVPALIQYCVVSDFKGGDCSGINLTSYPHHTGTTRGTVQYCSVFFDSAQHAQFAYNATGTANCTFQYNYASNVKRGFNHDTSDNSCLVLKNNVFTVLPNGYGFYLLGSRDSVIQNNIISLGGGNAVGILASGPTMWGESTRLLIQNNVIKRTGNWGGESWGMWLDKGRHISKGNHTTQPENLEIRNNGVHASFSNELPAAVGYVNGNYGIEGPLKGFPNQPTSSSFRFSNDQCPNYP